MVAVVSGSGLGLQTSSRSTLGAAGTTGDPQLGRGNESVFVNTTNGNLVVQSLDENLAALGLDLALVRTYNSQGVTNDTSDGMNAGWRFGTHLRVHSLSGTVNTANSTVKKVFGDGSEVTYTYNTALANYLSTDGEGAHDTLSWNGTIWTWTDASSRVRETYNWVSGVGRIQSTVDANGNTVGYFYDANNLLNRVRMAGTSPVVQDVWFDFYTGTTDLEKVRVESTDANGLTTQALTRYYYDGSGRLTTVRTDMNLADQAMDNANAYVTSYTYDGTSDRIASITQTRNASANVISKVGFTYMQVGSSWRVRTVVDGEKRVATYNYSDVINPGGNSTQPATPGWSIPEQLQTPGTGPTGIPQVAFDPNGNGFAVWVADGITGPEGRDIVVRRYVAATNTWGPETVLDAGGPSQGARVAQIAVDEYGNAIVAWSQSDGAGTYSIYASRYSSGTNTWSGAALLENGAGNADYHPTTSLAVAMVAGNGAAVSWVQSDGTYNSTYVARWDGTSWSVPSNVESATGHVKQTTVAMDNARNVIVTWVQPDALAVDAVYVNRFNFSAGTWSGAQAISAAGQTASRPQIAMDFAGNAFVVWVQGLDIVGRRYDLASGSWQAQQTFDTGAASAAVPSLAMDRQSGVGFVVWVQSDGVADSVYARRFSGVGASLNATVDLLDRTNEIVGSVNQQSTSGIAASMRGTQGAVMWTQSQTLNGTNYIGDVMVARLNGGTWQTPDFISNNAALGGGFFSSVGVDARGNVGAIYCNYYVQGGADFVRYTAPGAWTGATSLSDPTQNSHFVKSASDANGNVFALYISSDLRNALVRRFDKASNTWGAVTTLGATNGTQIGETKISVDEFGNAIFVWQQNFGSGLGLYAARYNFQTNSWTAAEQIQNATQPVDNLTPGGFAVQMSGSNAVIAWMQKNGSTYDVWAARYANGTLVAPVSLEVGAGQVTGVSASIDKAGNIGVAWQQFDTTLSIDRIAMNRYTASTGWSGTTMLSGTTAAASSPQIGYDARGNGLAIWAQGNDVWANRFDITTGNWGTAAAIDNVTGVAESLSLSVDREGNAIAAWIQTDAGIKSLYAARYTLGSGWSPAVSLESSSQVVRTNPGTAAVVTGTAIHGNHAAVTWLQKTGIGDSNPVMTELWATRWNGSAWSGPEMMSNEAGLGGFDPTVAIDHQGNTTVLWSQYAEKSQVFVNRYIVNTPLSGEVRFAPDHSSAGLVRTAYDSAGNGFAAWTNTVGGVTTLWVSRYNKATNTWSNPEARDSLTSTFTGIPAISMDDGGNAVLTWSRHDGTNYSTYASLYSARTATWSTAQVIDTSSQPVAAGTSQLVTTLRSAIASETNAAVIWLQSNGSVNDVYVSRWNGVSWSTTLVDNQAAAATHVSVAIDLEGNVSAVWQQSDGAAESIYHARYTATSPTAGSWAAASQLDIVGTATSRPVVASDSLGNVIAAWIQGNSVMARRYDRTSGSWAAAVTVATPPAAPEFPALAVDAMGNAVLAWVGSDGTANSMYGSIYTAGGSWSTPTLLENTSLPVGATSSAGFNTAVAMRAGLAVVTWTQSNTWGLTSQFQARWNGSAWSAAEQLDNPAEGNGGFFAAVGIDAQGNTFAHFPHWRGTNTANMVNRYAANNSYTQTTVADGLGRITIYKHDSRGRLISVATPAVNGARNETQFQYDRDGNVNSIIENATGTPRTTTMIYDTRGNLIIARAPDGTTTRRTYDTNNQLTVETVYRVPDAGTPRVPETTRFYYDAASNLRFVVSADGRVTEHRYYSSGTLGERQSTRVFTATPYTNQAYSMSDLTSWAGQTANVANSEFTQYFYDGRGTLQRTERWATTNASGAGTGTASITRYTYDQRGLLKTKIEPRGEATGAVDYITNYVYDAMRRVTSITEWVTSTNTRTVKSITYDDVNNRVVTTMANGLVSTAVFDKSGRLLTESKSEGATTFGTTSFNYDFNGRLIMTTLPVGDAAGTLVSPDPVRTYIVYDEMGRRVGDVDADGTLTQYIYNRLDQVTRTIRYSSLLSSTMLTNLYNYGTQGFFPVSIKTLVDSLASVAGRDAKLDQITRNVYDTNGRLVYTLELITAPDGVTDYWGVTRYFYNSSARLTDTLRYSNSITQLRTAGELKPGDIEPLLTANSTYDRRTRNFHDRDGNVVGTIDAEGFAVEYKYDSAGRLTKQIAYANASATPNATSHEFDAVRPSTDTSTGDDPEMDIVTRCYYDGQGRKIGTLDGEGYFTEHVYDVDGNLTRESRYDKVLTATDTTSFNDLRNLVVGLTGLGVVAHTKSFEYDGARRLTKTTEVTGTAWSDPVTSGSINGGTSLPFLAFDSAGNGIVMSTTNVVNGWPTDVMVRRYNASTQTWGSLQTLDSGSGMVRVASLSMDDAGNALVAWSQDDGNGTYSVYAARYTISNGQWSATASLESSSQQVDYYYQPKLATSIAAANAGAVSWIQYDGTKYSTYVSRWNGTAWTATRVDNTTATTSASSEVSVAIDTSGRVNAVWTETNTANSNVEIRYARYSGSAWSTATTLDAAVTTRSKPSVSLDSSGNGFAVWVQNGQLLARRFTAASGWGTTSTVSTVANTNAVQKPTFAMSSNGTAVVAWVQGDPADQNILSAYATRWNGSSWSAATQIDDSSFPVTNQWQQDSRAVYVAMRGNHAAVGFSQTQSGGSLPYGTTDLRVSRWNGTGWDAPETVDQMERGMSSYFGAVGIDGQGKTYAGWTNTNWAPGVRISSTEPGDVTILTYDQVDNVTRTERAAGTLDSRAVEAKYDVLGRVVKELSAAGRALINGGTPQAEIDRIWIDYGTSYAYDNAGRRVSATRRLEGTSTLLTSYYYYDVDGRLLFEVDPSGYVKENVYNALGQLTSTIDHVVPLSTANLASLRGGLITAAARTTLQGTQNTALDGRVTYTYSTRGAVATSTTAEAALTTNAYTNFGELRTVTTKFDATRSPVTRYVYDRRGLLKEVYGDDGGLNQLQTQSYDAFGRIRSAMVNGATTQYEYDRLGREIATVDPLSARRTTSYDGFSRVMKSIDALGAITTYAYNNATRRATIVTPEGVALASEYNRHGEVVRVTSRTDTTIYEYNADGQLKKVSDSLGTIEQHSHDSLGREFESRDANNNLTRFSYDASSRIFTRTVDPGGLNLVTQYGYNTDATSRYVDTTEPGGMVTRTRYDRDGQVISITAGFGTVDASTTTYAYDNAGHQILVTEGSNGAAPRRTRYAYDTLGRLTTKTVDPTDLGGAQALNIITDYKFDSKGNLSRTIEASNKAETRSTWYTYDAKNRIVQTIDALGAVTELSYDAEDRVVTTRRYSNTVTAGSLGDTPAKQGVKASVNDRLSRTVYDRDGRVEIHIDSAGAVTRFQYDASGNVSQTTQYANVPSNPAMRLFYLPATNSSASRYLGSFAAGDVVTATVRFKAPPDTSGAMFLGDAGGPDPYDNDEYTLVYGNDGWQTLTLTHTMSHDDVMYLYLYGDRDGAYANSTHSVLYDDATVVSVQRGTVLSDNFAGTVGTWSVSGPTSEAVSLTLADYGDDATIRSVVNGLANSAGDRVTRNLYDARNRLESQIDASGAVTRYQYDANGNVIQKSELANTVPVDGAMRVWYVPQPQNSSASRYLGNFNAGDVVTATVRFKAPADTSGRIFLGDAGGPDPYDNYIYSPVTYGNDGWQTLTATWTLTHADDMYLFVYGDRDGAYANTTHSVIYDDVKVVSAQRGTVLEDRFDGTVPSWSVSGTAQAVSVSMSDAGNEAALRSLVNSLASATQDRVTQFWYDAANRVRFALDGEKYLKETQYDTANRRQVDITFGTAASTISGSMTLAQVYDDVYVTTPLVDSTKDAKTTTQYDFLGRVTGVTRENGTVDVTESYGYDALGNKTSYTNARGTVWNYAYYANGLLKEEVSPTTTFTEISASATNLSDGPLRSGRIVTRMTYDAFGNVKTRQEGILRQIDNSELTQYSRTTSYDYDLVGRQTMTTYPSLMVYTYPTNDENRTDNTTMLQETLATPTSTVSYNSFGDAVLNLDVGQQYSHKAYDNLGRVRFEVDALRNVTEYTYDAFGNQKTVTRYATALNPAAVTGSPALSDSAVWSLADIELRRPTLTDSRKMTMEFDRANRQTSATASDTFVYTTNSSSTPGSQTSAGAVTKYFYNAFGQISLQRKLLDPLAQTFADTYFFYDRGARLVTQVDPEGYVTKTWYDARDNVTRKLEYFSRLTTAPESWNAASTPPVPPAGDFDHDIDYTYDLLDRMTAQAVQNVEYSSIAEGTGAVTMYQGVQNTTFAYDVVGNRTTVTDHYGRSTYTYYDAHGRITAVAETIRDTDDSWFTADVIPLTEMYRDIYGNLTKEVRYTGGASAANAISYTTMSAPNGRPDQFSRQLLDKYGHIIRSQDSFGGNRFASYDRRGNVAKEWQPVRNADDVEEMLVTIHKYDALGREIAIIEPQRRSDAVPTPTTHAVTSETQYRTDGGTIRWQGTNTVQAGWQDLLSDDYFFVVIRYWRETTTGGQASEDIISFTRNNIRNGGEFSWTDPRTPGPPPNDGAIYSIQYLQVYTRDAGGSFTVLVRDSRGNPPIPTTFTQMVYTKVKYNAFGEIIGKGVNMNVAPDFENYQEYFEYDAAGRVIRTNAGDGVTKVYVHDVAGRVTAEIKSKQTDLRAIALNLVQSQALTLAEGQQIRTEKVYNKVDQIVMQRLPRFGLGDITDPVATSVTAGLVNGPNFARAFHRRVQAPTGGGPVVYYYVIDPTVTGADGGWYRGESGNYIQQPGFAQVSKARLYWNGTWDAGVVMTFRYRVGTGNWTNLTVYPISTTQLAVDLTGIPNNTYEYEISYRRTTENQNSAFSRGTFTVNGSTYSATVESPTPSYVRPDVLQSQDRWGNVTSYTGTNDQTTTYRYSVLGNLVKTTMPVVGVVDTRTATDPNYTPQPRAPFTYNYYDALGRSIGARDANLNLTYAKLNNAGQVLHEYFANGTHKDYAYDVLGNQIQVTDQLGWRTYLDYNSANLLVQVAREYESNLYSVVYYEYDKAHRRISETSGETMTNSSAFEKTRYYYDLNGNVQRRRSALGFDTSYEYDGDGHKIKETNGIGQVMTWAVDHFGRVTGHMDLSGAVTVYDYSNNYAGLLGRQYMTASSFGLPTQNINYYYDDAGNLTLIDDLAVQRRTIFAYDQAGRRSRERTVVENRNHQSTIIEYDEHDRIKNLSDLRYTLNYQYDAQGNRTHTTVTYKNHTQVTVTDNLWYQYDEMNRVRLSQGIKLANGALDINDKQGIIIHYDNAGQRDWIETFGGDKIQYHDYETYEFDPDYQSYQLVWHSELRMAFGRYRETYTYDGAGRLKDTSRTSEYRSDDYYGNVVQYDTGIELVNRKGWDKASRLTREQSFITSANVVRTEYDDDGRLWKQTTRSSGQDTGWRSEEIVNTYDAANNLNQYSVNAWRPGTNGTEISRYTSQFRNTYYFADAALLYGQNVTTSGPELPPGATSASGRLIRGYNANRELISVTDPNQATSNRFFVNNAAGQQITAVQGNYHSTSLPGVFAQALAGDATNIKSQHFFFAGNQNIGSFGQLKDSSGQFKANFDVNFTPVSELFPAAQPMQVVTQQGDTLRIIAGRIYGDSSLWYLIAEENGYSDPDAALSQGIILNVPSNLVSVANNSSSFKPFNPADAVGDMSPTQIAHFPPPPVKKGCGVLGMILVIVVVIIVTVVTYGTMTAPVASGGFGMGTVAAGAIAGAAGSVAGQLVGMAAGMQDKFDWRAVALGAISGAIGAGVGEALKGVKAIADFADKMPYLYAGIEAAAGNIVTQGVSVAVGLQEKFNWRSVAMAAMTAPIAQAAGDFFGAKVDRVTMKEFRTSQFDFGGDIGKVNFERSGIANFVKDVASGTAAVAVRGAFGGKTQVVEAAADVFGNAIGNSIASAMTGVVQAAIKNWRERHDGPSSIEVLPPDPARPDAIAPAGSSAGSPESGMGPGGALSGESSVEGIPQGGGGGGGNGEPRIWRRNAKGEPIYLKGSIEITGEMRPITDTEGLYRTDAQTPDGWKLSPYQDDAGHKAWGYEENGKMKYVTMDPTTELETMPGAIESFYGVDDASMQRDIDNGRTGFGWATWFGVKTAVYRAHNFVTLDFVDRQDYRWKMNTVNAMTSDQYWKSTAIDGGGTALAVLLGGRGTNMLLNRLGTGYRGFALSTGAGGAITDLTFQSTQMLDYQVTGGLMGQEEFSIKQFATSTIGAATLGTLVRGARDVPILNRPLSSLFRGTAAESGALNASRFGIPKTGVARFDQRAVDSRHFDRAIKAIEARGFRVKTAPLGASQPAYVKPGNRTFVYDPKHMTYLDLRHEINHLQQFKLAGSIRIGGGRGPRYEFGTYLMERSLGVRHGFSREYMNYLDQQLNSYGSRLPHP